MQDLLSWFWAPLCAVGAPGPHGPNAQICVSVLGASIVPDRPRLLVILSNTNYTAGLVRTSGHLGITLLAAEQIALLEPLGLHSGRDGNKLGGLAYRLDAAGAPLFEGSAGTASCAVIEHFDLGDSTAFLCAVRERASFEREPLRWPEARERVGPAFMERWLAKTAVEQAAARQVLHWQA